MTDITEALWARLFMQIGVYRIVEEARYKSVYHMQARNDIKATIDRLKRAGEWT